MGTHVNKPQKSESQPVAAGAPQVQQKSESALHLDDNRPEADVQRKLIALAGNSPQAQRMRFYHTLCNTTAQAKNTPIQGKFLYTGLRGAGVMEAIVEIQKQIPLVKKMAEHEDYTIDFNFVNEKTYNWSGVTLNNGKANLEIVLNLAKLPEREDAQHTLTHELLLHGIDHFRAAIAEIESIPAVELQHDRIIDTKVGADYHNAQMTIIQHYIEAEDYKTATGYTVGAMQEIADTISWKSENREDVKKNKTPRNPGYSTSLTKDECDLAKERIINLRVGFEKIFNTKMPKLTKERYEYVTHRLRSYDDAFSSQIREEKAKL